MPNPFDQFDAPSSPGANPFDKFDRPKGIEPRAEARAESGEEAFFGLPNLLPEAVKSHLPDFLTGPSVGEQLTAHSERRAAEEQRLGRPLTANERLQFERGHVMESPLALGFGTHQIGALGDAMAAANSSAAEAFINQTYTRAVKPTVVGKSTASQLDRYQDQARGAIDSIVKNKTNLSFTDDKGEVISGELPKTLEQFSDAIEQTKKGIFQKYDALAKQTAGTSPMPVTGIGVSLAPVTQELTKIAGDPVVQTMHPKLVKYAQDRAAAFYKTQFFSTTEAQQAVEMLNQSLKAFYKNPTYKMAARANVDAMIANQLRRGLDETITNVSGPGYQDLKNEYGALKAIEEHVTKRAQIVARQEKGGGILGRIADVVSAEEALRGIFTLDPMALARGAAVKGWSQYVKWLRSPNRAVSRLFEAAESQRPTDPAQPGFNILPLGEAVDERRSRVEAFTAEPADQMIPNLNAAANKRGEHADWLKIAKDTMQPQEWRGVGARAVRQMGNGDESFSLQDFAGNWDKLSAPAKAALFDDATNAALRRLTRAVQHKDLVASGWVGDAITRVLPMVEINHPASQVLTSPGFAKWMNELPSDPETNGGSKEAAYDRAMARLYQLMGETR